MKKVNTKTKYLNKKCEYNGKKFDSLAEKKRYIELLRFEMAGEITGIGLQPRIYMTKSKILYKPDFVYFCKKQGKQIFEDVKGGYKYPSFAIKARLWKHYGSGRLDVLYPRGNLYKVKTIETEYVGISY